MSTYRTLMEAINVKGKEALHAERTRLREAYMKSKASLKTSGEWTADDDKALDALDEIAGLLCERAGFRNEFAQPPRAPIQTVGGIRPTVPVNSEG
jgi:hypothetical protein